VSPSLEDQIEELLDLLPPGEQALPTWSLEAFADGHAPQLAAMRDRSNWLHFLCDRQSGKTWADLGILLDNALANPNSVNVFLGLVGVGLELSVWPKWTQLTDRFRVDCTHNETLRTTYFPNGAMVAFGGTDTGTVRKYLGNRLHNSVFIIDESQDQRSSVLKYILDTMLEPMCTPTTRVILSGVLPDLPVGHFLDLAEYDPASQTGGKKGSDRWSHHSWSRLENIHTPEAAQMLAALEVTKGADDPQLLRDWKGVQRVWDASLTAYRYKAARDAWTWQSAPWAAAAALPPGVLIAAVPPEGIDRFAIGLDPAATADRFAIVMWGWSAKERLGLWQVAEWVTARGANSLESQWVEVLKVLKARYSQHGHVGRIIRDSAGGTGVGDLLRQSHGIVIEPVIKGPGSLRARVDRLADVLGTGQAHIMAGSELENDLKLAKWSMKAREEGRWEFDDSHHPDVADAGTYGAVAYFEAHQKPEGPKYDNETQAVAAGFHAAIEQRMKHVPKQARPRDSRSLWKR
jgi:hypothetical protein